MGKVLYVRLLTFVLICTLTEEADKHTTTVSKRMVAVLSGKKNVEKRAQNNDCWSNGRFHTHGDIFSGDQSRSCIKYRCENGVAQIIQEGCYYYKYGRCYSLGAFFVHDCHTYTCVKKSSKTEEGSSYHYLLRNTGPPKCKDYYGLCRLPGEKFSYKMNGHVYLSCVCRQIDSVRVKVECEND